VVRQDVLLLADLYSGRHRSAEMNGLLAWAW